MSEINTVLLCLQPFLKGSAFRQLTLISEAMLMMQGRITMLGISRWTDKGGSYRTIQRFFLTSIHWSTLNWALIKPRLRHTKGPIIIAGDATTVTKSGKKTFGLGRFFSSIYARPIPGIAFQTLSLIEVSSRRSWPVLMEQIAPTPPHKKPPKTKKKTTKKVKRVKGRPVGSTNKDLFNVALNAEMTQVKSMINQLLALVGDTLQPIYFVYDGAFGNNAAVRMTRSVGLHLISKLRNDSALCFEWAGTYAGKGPRPRYGERVNYQQLTACHLKSEVRTGGILTCTYQFKALHRKFAETLNIVVVTKLNEKTNKLTHVVLFSTDLELDWVALVKYYQLRFQIEFNFRDAKQHWGLEDFMVIKAQAVNNAANLSLFMVNVSQTILASTGETSILDLKARAHCLRYAQEAFKILPQNAQVISFDAWVKKIPVLGRIHEQRHAA